MIAKHYLLLVIAASALLIIYPLPNVIAFRNVLLLCALALCFPITKYALSSAMRSVWSARAIWLIVFLVLWMIVVAVFIDPVPSMSLRELLGQWVTALGALLVGLCISIRDDVTSERTDKAVVLIIAISSLVHVAGHDLFALWADIKTQGIPKKFFGLTDHPANIGYVTTLVLPLFGADLISRASGARGLFPWHAIWTYCLLALSALALLTAGSRNSQVVFLVIVAIVAVTLWWRSAMSLTVMQRGLRVTALVAVIAVFAGTAIQLDGRWNRVVESIQLGWDTDGHKGWVYVAGKDIPTLSNGDPVEESAYLRTALLKEGLRALRTHPWGTEINKNAFRNLINQEYGSPDVPHAHNGLIDLGISAGVPAMILWCGFLVALFQAGKRAYKITGSVIGYAMMLLVIGFSIRMFLDSTLRDHIILQFMLCAGLLLGACVQSMDARQQSVPR